MKPSSAPQKTFAEFFAGIGLMRMGLEQAGWKIAFANDICADKFEMYRGHFEDTDDHFIREDIHHLQASEIPTVTLATASFPCNDLSLAGGRAGLSGSQSSAFFGFIRLLKEMRSRRPPLVLIENVPGFLTSNAGADFREALLALNQLGYAVDAFMIDAALFVPQSRQRLFVVGSRREDPTTPGVAEKAGDADFFQSSLRPPALAEFIFDHPEIDWQLRDLIPPAPQHRTLPAVLEMLPDDAPEWWNEERTAYLFNQMSPRHRALAEQMMRAETWSYGTVFRRVRAGRSMAELRVDGIAGCLRTPRGGSGRQILVKAGHGEFHVRLLTPRECARLMGADDFKVTVSANQALFGFGDAVCVPVIAWIAEHYLNLELATPLPQEIRREKALKYA